MQQTSIPTSAQNWREMDSATRSIAYNNGAAVSNSAEQLARWRSLSEAVRRERPAQLDLRYGPLQRNLIDMFPSDRLDAPLLVFVHGGYWQRNSKDDFSCMALGPLAHGLAVAVLGYTLAPDATLTTIAEEIRTAVDVLRHQDENAGLQRRLVISGWSAGGHLAALAAAWPGVNATLAISGIFDLEPLRGTSVIDKLHLTEAEVQTLSPIKQLAPRQSPMVIAYGANELPELCRQSCDYDAACRAQGFDPTLLPVSGADHFSVLDSLIDPAGVLTAAAVSLARSS